MGRYKPKLYHYAVKWGLPNEGVIKYYIDGATRGNPTSG